MENLRDWYQPEPPKLVRPPKYRSKFDPKAKPCYSTFSKNVPSETPNHLKRQKLKPRLPKELSNPIKLPGPSTRNFLKDNAVEAILSKPKFRAESNTISKRQLQQGAVPKYLTDIKDSIQLENQLIEEYITSSKRSNEYDELSDASAVSSLPEADRLALINQLKRKWGLVNRQYQNIIGNASRTKIQLKERLEAELSRIENDIKLLSRGPIKVSE